jgi:adenosylhomocysteinase
MTDATYDKTLVEKGQKRIEWAERDMPVLRQVREQFTKDQPLKGKVLAAVLHVTCETANLVRALKAGGAEVYLAASNPLSTQDDVVAALNEVYGIPTFAHKGESTEEFFAALETLISKKPNLTMDDGADLVTTIHQKHPELLTTMYGGTEETTTGVIRLRAMHKDGALKMPVVAVNDAKTKNMFDNRYGTGQSTLDGIIRATDTLIAGKNFVVLGYGWCGKGLAMRARGAGANVIVTEIDAVKALEAAMDGFRVMPMSEAASIGDIFCTVTGNKHVIREEHFKVMKDGAIVCNSGHFDVEIDLVALKKLSSQVRTQVRPNVDEFTVGTSRINVLAEGRLVNLAAAEGHPASVMDMSFATQAIGCAWMATQKERLAPAVYEVADEIEAQVSTLKLASMGLTIDKLTKEQEEYLTGWQEGT